MSKTPVKDDSMKPPMDLIPPRALREVAKCMQNGASKYGKHNFLQGEGMAYTRLIAAVLRHINAYQCGEEVADDTGYSHIAHAASGCLMLLEEIMLDVGVDDRFKKAEKPSNIALGPLEKIYES